MINVLNSSAQNLRVPSCRTISQIVLTCAVLLSTLSWSSPIRANSLETIYNPGTSTDCGDERCCWEFDFQVDQSTDELIVQLLSDPLGASDNCIDWTCFANQFGGTITYTKLGTGRFKLTFNPAITSGQVLFTLCPLRDSTGCNNVWTGYEWETTSGGSTNDNGFGVLNNCNGTNCDASCDGFSVFTSGVQTFCFHRFQATEATTITMTFNPGLDACHELGMDYTKNNNDFDAPGATVQFGPVVGVPPYTTLTFTAPAIGGDGIDPCESFCVTLPICQPATTTTVTMTGSPNASTCSTKIAALKPTGDGGYEVTQADGTVQNFPNPVTSNSSFKTKIPFDSQTEGLALLRVYSTTGKLELTQSFNAMKGENHFELSAVDLPRGTYYYVVESPIGVPIVNKTMVVIK